MHNLAVDHGPVPTGANGDSALPTLAPGRTLRLATLADLEGIMRLERYCFSPWLAFGHLRWKKLLNRSEVWLVLQGEQVLAYLCLVPHRGWHSLNVHALAVHWQVRQQGIASLLLAFAVERARALDLPRLRLEVEEENERALRLYLQQGFVLQRSLPHYYGLERHGYRLICPLFGK
jgi:Acetyltransferases